MPETGEESVIDDAKRFSETVLWKLQRDFYEKNEVKCWQECIVPNFVTSNCYIAHAYARSIAAFLRDHFGRDGTKRVSSQPLYIVEIGAGSAKLSYALLKKLLKLWKYLPRRSDHGDMGNTSRRGGGRGGDFCFKYVITDFSHANFGFWMNHPRLHELFSLGIVDFAVFDAEAEPTSIEGQEARSTNGVGDAEPSGVGVGLWGSGCLRLELSGEEIRPESLEHPIVVVANYVFDSLKQDAFRVHEGALEEVLCTTSTSRDVADRPLAPEVLPYIRCSWTPVRRRAHECYPDDARLSKALQSLAASHQEASFLVPVGAVRAIDSLRALVKGSKALILAGDKGYVEDSEFERARDPHLAVHGSFSCMVNFRLLHFMCEAEGGNVVHSRHLDGFKCSAMAYGLDAQAYPQFRMSFKESTSSFSPNGFSSLQRLLKEETRGQGLGLRPALALLRLSQHDPDVFYKFKQVFVDKGPYAGEKLQNDIRRDVKLVHDLYFPLQPSKDVAFEIGRIFMGLKDFDSAAELFRDSQRFCGVHHVSWYNMGVCFFYLSRLDQAEECFEESLALCPDYPDAIKWKEKLANVQSFLAVPKSQASLSSPNQER